MVRHAAYGKCKNVMIPANSDDISPQLRLKCLGYYIAAIFSSEHNVQIIVRRGMRHYVPPFQGSTCYTSLPGASAPGLHCAALRASSLHIGPPGALALGLKTGTISRLEIAFSNNARSGDQSVFLSTTCIASSLETCSVAA